MLPRWLALSLCVGAIGLPASGQHLIFDEGTDTVLMRQGSTPAFTAMTLEAILWVRDCAFERRGIFQEQRPFQENKVISVWSEAGQLTGAGYAQKSSPSPILQGTIANPDRWVHLAYVYDGAEERLYFDGRVRSRNAVTGSVSDASFDQETLRLGANLPSGGAFYEAMSGAIDSIRMVDRAVYFGDEIDPPSGDLPAVEGTVMLFHFNEQPDVDGMIFSEAGTPFFRGEIGAPIGGGIDGTDPTIGQFGCIADLDADGLLDLGDVSAFIGAFVAGESPADLAPPCGVLDLSDIETFVSAFLSGCL